MARHRIVDGVVVHFTPEEETQRDADEAVELAAAPARAAEELRAKRNQLLTGTDWWVLRGSPTDAQTAYRTALRDLPANTADPANPTWPEEPS